MRQWTTKNDRKFDVQTRYALDNSKTKPNADNASGDKTNITNYHNSITNKTHMSDYFHSGNNKNADRRAI